VLQGEGVGLVEVKQNNIVDSLERDCRNMDSIKDSSVL